MRERAGWCSISRRETQAGDADSSASVKLHAPSPKRRQHKPLLLPASTKTPLSKLSCVERLQAVRGAVTTVDDILSELFPFEPSYRRAKTLVAPPSTRVLALEHDRRPSPVSRAAAARENLNPRESCTKTSKHLGVASLLSRERPQSPNGRSTAVSLPSPSALPPVRLASRAATTTAHAIAAAARDDHEQHTLALWDDKFRARTLSHQDVLFLVTHPDVANVLESASLLRAADVTYDQLMELEIALDFFRAAAPRVTQHDVSSLYEWLSDRVWQHGVAFRASALRRLESATSPRKVLLSPVVGGPRAASPLRVARASTCPERTTNATSGSCSPHADDPFKSRHPQQRRQTALSYDQHYAQQYKDPRSELDIPRDGTAAVRQSLQSEHDARMRCNDLQHRHIGPFVAWFEALHCCIVLTLASLRMVSA